MGTQKPNHHHLLTYHLLLISTFSLLLRCRSTTDLPVQYHESKDLQSVLFEQWSERHGKLLEHVTFEESLKRFENFRRNLRYVAEHNSSQTGFTIGLNRFSDLSNDEFKERYLSNAKQWVQWVQLNKLRTSSVLTCDAPSYLDWREMDKVSPVKDRDGCGSRGASSSTDAVDVENDILSIDGYVHVEKTESALLCATVNQPISVGIECSSIDFQLYTGGIYDGSCSSNPDNINHVVEIVGYGSEGNKDYWIVKNSWGTNWGMDGYIYIRRNTKLPYGVCAINALASYPLLTSLASAPSPSSSSTPPPASPPYIPPPQPLPPAAAPPPSSPPPSPSPSPPPPPSQPPSSPPPPSSTPPPTSPPYIPPPQPLPPAAAPPPSSPPPPPPPPSPSPSPSPSPPPPPFPPPPSPSPSPPLSSPPPPPPPPASSPPPPPPASSPPPPPPPPLPPPTPSRRCGDFTYCLPGQTCCCLYESFGFCLIQGCCRYSKAVCCPESDYCCPVEYPICDVDDGLCLKDSGDKLGIALSKKKWAKPTLPWSKLKESIEVTYQPLRWRRNGYAIAR